MPGIKKILSFSKSSKFCKQEIYKNDHIIDIHVNTKVLTTGLVIPSGTCPFIKMYLLYSLKTECTRKLTKPLELH